MFPPTHSPYVCIMGQSSIYDKYYICIIIYIYIYIIYLCTGLAQVPSQCMYTLRIDNDRADLYIMPGVTNCISCVVAGNVVWQITVNGILIPASSALQIASVENNYLIIPSPESYVLPGQSGRRMIECIGASSSLGPRLASPSKMDQFIVILLT